MAIPGLGRPSCFSRQQTATLRRSPPSEYGGTHILAALTLWYHLPERQRRAHLYIGCADVLRHGATPLAPRGALDMRRIQHHRKEAVTVAIYYMNVQIIGRSAGRTATGAAAYRAGERITDERTGRVFDYTHRRGDIETQILAPVGAPEWVKDRGQLWNQVEKAEKRGDAQLCREMVVAIPLELDRQQQTELVCAYVNEEFVSRGMVADVAIHRNPGNPHAHIMLTMREVGAEGFSSKKNRDWNRVELLEEWRERWAVAANRALERAGREERIDHRTLAEQGSDRLPQVHLGPHSAALERQGVSTEKGEHNRLVAEHNSVVIDLEKARQERRQLQAEKAVGDRFGVRLQAGWSPSQAQALGKLEKHLGGNELTRSEVDRVLASSRDGFRQLQQHILEVRQEGQRLDRGAELLARRQAAAGDVERLKSSVAVVKRVFNAGAREELRRAEEQLRCLDQAVRQSGVTSKADLEKQRERWRTEEAQLPTLEESASRLAQMIEWAAKALEGFEREQDRDYDYLQRRKRSRPREADRDR